MAAQQGCSPAISSQCLALGSAWVRTQLLPHQIHLGSGTTKQNLLSSSGVQCSLRAVLQPAGWAPSVIFWNCWNTCCIPGRCGAHPTAACPKHSSHTGLWKQHCRSGSAGCWYAGSMGRSLPESPKTLLMTLFWVAYNLKYKRRYR